MTRYKPIRRGRRCLSGAAFLAALCFIAGNTLAQSSASVQPKPVEPTTVTEADLIERVSPDLLLSFAIENNPDIRAVYSDWEAAKERIRAQSWYENPMVTLVPDTGDMAETRAGPQGNSIEISQAIPFPGKLGLRGEIAESRASATYQVLEATIQEISRQVRGSYADYNLAMRSLDINDDVTNLTRQFAEVAQARYKVGKAAQQDVILAQEQLSRLTAERIIYLGDAEIAIGVLNALLDRPPEEPLGAPGDLDARPLVMPLARLIDAAEESRPELLSQDHLVEASRQAERLARLGYRPDFRLGVQWIDVQGGTNPTFARDGNDIWMVKLGFSVPLWRNRIGAEVRDMKAQVRRDEFRRRNLRNQVLEQVQRQYARVAVAARTEEIYRGTLIPQTTERIAAAQAGYQTGVVDFLTVIDSLRSLEQVRLQRDRAVRDYQQAFADLERAVGRPLSSLTP